MLVLSRKTNEKILIGKDIEITIVDVRGDVVKVGINAPREVSILRHELLEQVQRANQDASQASVATLRALERRLPAQDRDEDDPLPRNGTLG
ncbi:MAG: Translational regulator CsrA [bacterium]|nr:Translational regulator CsrA [bacterium]